MRNLLAVLALGSFAFSVRSAEQDLTPLHPPTVILLPPTPMGFEQPSRLAIWQYYAVDRSGHFRPRVPLNPQPFNPATVQPRNFIPYLFD
jgi:hypothetical protein